jgi:hypothetical protein
MFKLRRYPYFGKSFFCRARKIVGCCHFAHLWRIVIAFASLQSRSSLSRIEERTDRRRNRQAISHFLTRAEWDAPELLRETALATLRQLKYRPEETLYAVIDDTQVEKFGKRMDAVQKIFLHAQQRYAPGHTVVGCALIYRNVVIPYSVALWTPKDFPGQPFRKLTVRAADLIRGIALPGEARPIVLFDAYYLCPAVTDACRQRHFPFVGVARSNRRFRPEGRPRDTRRLKQASLGSNLVHRQGALTRAAVIVSGLKYQLSVSPCLLALKSQGKRVDHRQNVLPVLLDLSMNGADRS